MDINLSDSVDKYLKSIDSVRDTISQIFEIRLNPQISQDIFTTNQNNIIDWSKQNIKLISEYGLNFYNFTIKNNNRDIIIYFDSNNNKFYRFDKDHFNLNMTIDNIYYVCNIKYYDFEENNFELECKDYLTNKIDIIILSSTEFIEKLSNLDAYIIDLLNIFL
jgi:hypothetical protein